MRKDLLLRKEIWINECLHKFGDKFDYSNVTFQNATTNVLIICPVHGEFVMAPYNHKTSKHGCNLCGVDYVAELQKENSKIRFWKLVEENHGNLYDYSKTNYMNMTDKIIVICKIHEEFSITPDHHMRGVGCKKCAALNATGGYRSSWFNFDIKRKTQPGLFYIIEIQDRNDTYIKLGITKNTIQIRYKAFSFQYKVILEKSGILYDLWKLETHLKIKFKNQLYLNEKQIFTTESFPCTLLDDILKEINFSDID